MVGELGHGGLVGQSRGLLIYTFHKIIHVQGIPLPIWLVRTRVGGVFMELESSQKTEQWTNNDVASFPYMQISGLPLTGGLFDLTTHNRRRTGKLSTPEASHAAGSNTTVS